MRFHARGTALLFAFVTSTTAGAQNVLDPACFLPLKAAVDSLGKLHLASTTLWKYQIRAVAALTQAHTLYCSRIVAPAAPVTVTLTARDTIVYAAGAGNPIYAPITARVDSASVQIADSVAFSLSDPTLAQGRWSPSPERWFEIVRPTRDGVLYVYGRRGTVADTVRIVTRVATTPPPIDTTTPPPVGGQGVVELPRVVPSVVAGLRARPCTITAGTDLQASLNAQAATPGPSVLCLPPSATYVGKFVTPARADTAMRVVRTGNGIAAAVGQRLTPTQSVGLAKIIGNGGLGEPAMQVLGSNVAFVELEVMTDVRKPLGGPQHVVALGAGQETSRSALPQHITMDRVYLHGHPGQHCTRRGVLAHGRIVVIRDSWIGEIHDCGYDSQAIGGWQGGPLLVENTHIEGATENYMFGGADPSYAGGIMEDVTMIGNHIYSPIAWKGLGYPKKNAGELKAVRRMRIEGNVIDGSWAEGQGGGGLVVVSTNQGGTCPGCSVADVTVRGNIIRNTGIPLGIAASQGFVSDSGTRRVLVEGNYFESVNAAPYTGDARHLTVFANGVHVLRDITVRGNTWTRGAGTVTTCIEFGAVAPAALRFTFSSNICDSGTYGPFRGGSAAGAGAFTLYTPGALIGPNHLWDAPKTGAPANTTWGPTPPPGVGVDAAALRARLASVVVAP